MYIPYDRVIYGYSELYFLCYSVCELEEILCACGNYSNIVIKKLRGLSPQANYTDLATAAVGEVVPTFAGRGVLRGQRNEFPQPLISVS
jgi:hypothetical protein